MYVHYIANMALTTLASYTPLLHPPTYLPTCPAERATAGSLSRSYILSFPFLVCSVLSARPQKTKTKTNKKKKEKKKKKRKIERHSDLGDAETINVKLAGEAACHWVLATRGTSSSGKRRSGERPKGEGEAEISFLVAGEEKKKSEIAPERHCIQQRKRQRCLKKIKIKKKKGKRQRDYGERRA